MEAKIAIGGPILGSFAALVCGIFYMLTGKDFYLALCYTGAILNLFNLIPVHPVDGGRIVTAISPKIWFVGIPVMVLMLFKFFNPIIILLIILGIIQLINHYKASDKKYYEVENSTRVIFAILYFGLIVLLAFTATAIHNVHSINIR